MFISDKIVFIHLQKTAGVHISQTLSKLVDGEKIKEHPQLPEHLRSRYIIGSIRNPWDWYVSLWAYGCGGKGSVQHNLVHRFSRRQLDKMQTKQLGSYRPSLLRRWKLLREEKAKPIEQWRENYRDANDAGQFQAWLKRLLDPRRAYDLQEGYALSEISSYWGLLTYRHLKLQSTMGDELYTSKSLKDYAHLKATYDNHILLNHTIRNESIAEDLIAALDNIGVNDKEAARKIIIAGDTKKHNASKRMSVGEYYDAECRELVAARERLIIDTYNYLPPSS